MTGPMSSQLSAISSANSAASLPALRFKFVKLERPSSSRKPESHERAVIDSGARTSEGQSDSYSNFFPFVSGNWVAARVARKKEAAQR